QFSTTTSLSTLFAQLSLTYLPLITSYDQGNRIKIKYPEHPKVRGTLFYRLIKILHKLLLALLLLNPTLLTSLFLDLEQIILSCLYIGYKLLKMHHLDQVQNRVATHHQKEYVQ